MSAHSDSFASSSTVRHERSSVKSTAIQVRISGKGKRCSTTVRAATAPYSPQTKNPYLEWQMMNSLTNVIPENPEPRGEPELRLGQVEAPSRQTELRRPHRRRRNMTRVRDRLLETERIWMQEELAELDAEIMDLKGVVGQHESHVAKAQGELDKLMLALSGLSGNCTA
ncbi:hypothetical protein OE88DRAFT_1667034 [Heliocybe sulcata]|uniref:BZIP domain-containing protein n=1 Tax=Heliocybe sulcata TaxID=5364 RepID=A0A5C3MPJ0_9AGAM|nr:hypothetical protein OE88DRAFT_1667034 [Heliocybe sulcata]